MYCADYFDDLTLDQTCCDRKEKGQNESYQGWLGRTHDRPFGGGQFLGRGLNTRPPTLEKRNVLS